MNNFKFTKFALSLTGIFFSISSIICLFNNDYPIISATLILCIPGLFFGLAMDSIFNLGSDKE